MTSVAAIYELHLLTMKPMLYIANVDEDQLDAELPEIDGCAPGAHFARRWRPTWPSCRDDPAEAQGVPGGAWASTESGLARLVREAYHLLGLQSYFTSGETETRAWTIPVGAKAPQAAGVIHTDFERGFIKAETAAFEDYVGLGRREGLPRRRQAPPGRQGVRGAGRRRHALQVQRVALVGI